jgi:hypothetical protein
METTTTESEKYGEKCSKFYYFTIIQDFLASTTSFDSSCTDCACLNFSFMYVEEAEELYLGYSWARKFMI